ncbi:MAG: ABC transporter permease [Candidatus Latescibacterota bacterium]|nr:MAG: ABC transporter permease [Candidatus Latescibacterota bacterium]
MTDTANLIVPGADPERPGAQGWTRFRRSRYGMTGAAIVLALYLAAAAAPLIARYDPAEQGDVPRMRFVGPCKEHPLGTDKFGRDVLSRILYGSRISLSVGLLAVTISVGLGALVGAAAGYFGGAVDAVLMRLVDALLAIPRLFLLLTCVAFFRGSIALVVVLLGATGWMAVARLVRGQVLAIRTLDYVKAAETLGARGGAIIRRHVLPNALTVIIVAATLRIGGIILTEASLSFLGLGVPPPTPSWGNMVFEGREALLEAWWLSTFPGLAIAVTVIGFNMLGDALKEAFDPRRPA